MFIPRSIAAEGDAPLGIALVGAGAFGATCMAQLRHVAGLELRLVCDREPERAAAALLESGYDLARLAHCSGRNAVRTAVEARRIAIVEDVSLLADLPIDVVVEATGHPDGAALVAELAIASGYHLALVTKETEVVIGPLLAKRAKAAGVVHTLVEGDQPSLLLGLIERARLLGLPVIAAGKATESDYVFDPADNTVTCWGRSVERKDYAALFAGEDLLGSLAGRVVAGLDVATVPDLCEMAIVANHSDLAPDRPAFHAPVARTIELARLFRPAEAGGLLQRSGAVDVFACLRRPDELSFAGGVFVVVETPNPATGLLLGGKGIPASGDGRYLLLHNPVHLLGVEAPLSILSAARLGQSTGGRNVRMRFDLAGRANRAIKAGEVLALGPRHDIDYLDPLVLTARPLGAEAPLPYYLAAGRTVARPIAAGAVVTAADVLLDETSPLLRLRREQDAAVPFEA